MTSVRVGHGAPVPPAFRLGEVVGTTVRMAVSSVLLGGALVWGLLGESAACFALLVLAALAGAPKRPAHRLPPATRYAAGSGSGGIHSRGG